MFCSQCGTKSVEEASFCHKCGVRLGRFAGPTTEKLATAEATATTSLSTASSSTTHRATSVTTPKVLAAGTGPPLLTFHEFQSKKENTRRSQFKPKPAKKQKLKEVKIKIGMITYRPELDELKVSRGSSTNHSVAVCPSVGESELIKIAVEKHSRFNRKLSDRAEEYFLLYPDKTRVEKLPGSQENFTLDLNLKFIYLGKPYDRITLYLCKVSDFYRNMTNQLIGVLKDDSSDDNAETASPQVNLLYIKF
jgi:hypothetical protein